MIRLFLFSGVSLSLILRRIREYSYLGYMYVVSR